MSLGNGLPLADWRQYAGTKDPIARDKAEQALANAVNALAGLGISTATGKISGIRYKIVVEEDQGGPQLSLEN